MCSLQWKPTCAMGAVVGVTLIMPMLAAAQSQTTPTQADRPNPVSVVYVPPTNPELQKLYDLLRDRRALEKIQETLSPFRFSEQLTIKTAECGVVNSWYSRENFKPTVTICYEFVKHILESLPQESTPAGVTTEDATVGQFFWVNLHEVGHATFDIFDVPIFGHEEDAADNFATYIMLQFGEGQAHRLIGGAAARVPTAFCFPAA
jgi:hypothetical protein